MGLNFGHFYELQTNRTPRRHFHLSRSTPQTTRLDELYNSTERFFIFSSKNHNFFPKNRFFKVLFDTFWIFLKNFLLRSKIRLRRIVFMILASILRGRSRRMNMSTRSSIRLKFIFYVISL